jgi:hypothetical protein
MGAESYVGVRVQGGLLPADLMTRLASGRDITGLSSADYGLAHGESVREAANRVWAYLTGVWTSYQEALTALPPEDRATSLTRDRWLQIVLDQLGYGRVATTPAGGVVVGDKQFPVSHLWQSVPVHLLGARIELDRKTAGVAGAAGQAPQSMVQELLNRSDDHLWAVLSNGAVFRLLRDSTSLVGSAYVEFDLEAIFEGELFSDFLLFYTVCHSSRVEVRDVELGPASCWLESWRELAFESGSRALNLLRDGVVTAIETLGAGFLGHPSNAALRDQVETGALSKDDFNHALLRVVYRLLFGFVAEDRGALLAPDATPEAVQRYREYFSMRRLRDTSLRRRGGRHADRWQALQLVWAGLGSDQGRPELGIAGIGGLYEPGPLDVVSDAFLTNEALLSAVRSLSVVTEKQTGFKRPVNHRDLGAEELGSIYEALLEYVPTWDPATREYRLGDAAGNVRKTTGSYYTPTSLIDCLLDSALDPVLNEAVFGAADAADAERRLLEVTVCDPACGSGHFLVGAARRIAKRVAQARSGDPEPPPEIVRTALRDVVGRCIYGVDINPLAAELAKVSLWLEAMEPGRPLAFLDAQIKVGNALIGATPALLDAGIPQTAFKPIEGDDKKFASGLAKRNKEEAGQDTLFGAEEGRVSNAVLVDEAVRLVGAGLSLADVHIQQQRLKEFVSSPEYRRQRHAADAWCAAFVWRKTEDAVVPMTNASFHRLQNPDADLNMAVAQNQEIARLAAAYRFFHWHLEFPHVFPTDRPENGGSVNENTGWYGGFSVVLGNPPWENIELKEQEFFASRAPDIAHATGVRRKKLISQLAVANPGLAADYFDAKRGLDGLRHFAADSGKFPLCGRGRIKTDSVFAETGRGLISAAGRFGMVLPSGIATDATTQHFFKDLLGMGSLSSMYDFENGKPLFEGVHRSFKFCLLTLVGRQLFEKKAEFAFFMQDAVQLKAVDSRFFLSPSEIRVLNPNTGTCPIFRTRRDAEITIHVYSQVPVLVNDDASVQDDPWDISFMQGLFNMTADSALFSDRVELETDGWSLEGNTFVRDGKVMRPVYEAKMFHHYDHRWSTYESGISRLVTGDEKSRTDFLVLPRYWIAEEDARERLDGKWDKPWLLGWRDICRSTDERTMIASLLGLSARPEGGTLLALCEPRLAPALLGCLNSFAFDFVARQKVGGTHLKFFTMKQLPVPSPSAFEQVPEWADQSLRDWLTQRVLWLNCRAVDMNELADEFQWSGSKRGWDLNSRAIVRSELDGAMFHLYGISRDDVEYIMETFPIVKKKELREFGEYRTKKMILDVYEHMAEAERTGVPYRSSIADLEDDLPAGDIQS